MSQISPPSDGDPLTFRRFEERNGETVAVFVNSVAHSVVEGEHEVYYTLESLKLSIENQTLAGGHHVPQYRDVLANWPSKLDWRAVLDAHIRSAIKGDYTFQKRGDGTIDVPLAEMAKSDSRGLPDPLDVELTIAYVKLLLKKPDFFEQDQLHKPGIVVWYLKDDVSQDMRLAVYSDYHNKERHLAIVKAAFEAGLFEPVAHVEDNDLEHAYKLTQNGVVSESWGLEPPKGLLPIKGAVIGTDGERYGNRPSMIGDVFTVVGEDGLKKSTNVVAMFGFKELV